MPPHIKGVINLRGRIIPVADLHLRLGLSETSPSDRTCIVVVQARSGTDARLQLGLLVDDVDEVV
jgi:purine-binding chemotaxis protein CheW